MARFWIDKHNYLRQQSEGIIGANDEFRAGRIDPEQFGSWLAPRLQSFLSVLHGHHQIEDFHYFPAFRRTEPRLNPGFDVLARDHELVHHGIAGIVESVNTFFSTLQSDATGADDARRHAADRYIEASQLLHTRLIRHLEDEEDLIIPLMIRQDEGA